MDKKIEDLSKLLDTLLKENESEVKSKPRLNPLIWTPVKLVLLVHNTKCLTCGNSWKGVNNYLHVELFHKQLGDHLKPVRDISRWYDLYKDLPREIRNVQSTSDVCDECFLTEKCKEQLSFNLEYASEVI